MEIEEEEKVEGKTSKLDENNSDYDTEFGVEPVEKDGKTNQTESYG